jgi:hypothetical protein
VPCAELKIDRKHDSVVWKGLVWFGLHQVRPSLRRSMPRLRQELYGVRSLRAALCVCSGRDVVMPHVTTFIVGRLISAIALASILVVPAIAFDVRPDPDSTEGAVRIDGHSSERACDRSKNHRGPMTVDRRDEVLFRYGLPAGYEIDHLIPLCLGGSDDFSNVWPQPRRTIEPKWNAEAKDRLERLLCDMVCNGQIEIGTAQEAIAKDWISAYQKYYEHDAVK